MVPVLTVDTKGRITNISSAAVSGGGGGVSAGAGLAVVSGTLVTVGTVSPVTATNISINAGNTIDTTHSGAINNIIAGGSNNTTSNAAYQTVAGGDNNKTTNNFDTVGGGSGNTASGGSSVVPGGSNNTASGADAIAAGAGCQASGAQSVSMGNGNVASGIASHATGSGTAASGNFSSASGQFTTTRGTSGAFINGGLGGPSATASFPGRGQSVTYTLFVQTNGATAVRLTTDGAAAGPTNIGVVPVAGLAMWTATITIADKDTFGKVATYTIGPSLIQRAGDGTMTLGTGNPVAVAGPTIGTLVLAAIPTLTADSTNFGFNLSFTPPVANTDNLYAVAVIEAVETQMN